MSKLQKKFQVCLCYQERFIVCAQQNTRTMRISNIANTNNNISFKEYSASQQHCLEQLHNTEIKTIFVLMPETVFQSWYDVDTILTSPYLHKASQSKYKKTFHNRSNHIFPFAQKARLLAHICQNTADFIPLPSTITETNMIWDTVHLSDFSKQKKRQHNAHDKVLIRGITANWLIKLLSYQSNAHIFLLEQLEAYIALHTNVNGWLGEDCILYQHRKKDGCIDKNFSIDTLISTPIFYPYNGKNCHWGFNDIDNIPPWLKERLKMQLNERLQKYSSDELHVLSMAKSQQNTNITLKFLTPKLTNALYALLASAN